jgi:hypothetical protein
VPKEKDNWQPGPRGLFNNVGGYGITPYLKRKALFEYGKLIESRGIFASIRFYYLKLVDLYTNSPVIGFSSWRVYTPELIKKLNIERVKNNKNAKYKGKLLDFVRSYIRGGAFPLEKIFNYLSWTVAMIGVFFSLIYFKKLKRESIALFSWSVMVIVTIYLMFLECSMRYLLPFGSFVVIAAAYGINEFYNHLDRLINKRIVHSRLNKH